MKKFIKVGLLAGMLTLLPALGACTAIIIGGAAVTTIIIANDERSLGAIIDDTSIEIKVASALKDNAGLSEQSYISATSTNGIVLLIGTAPSMAHKDTAGRLAKSVYGVRQVVNQVEIGSKPGTAQISSDAYLASKVKTLLYSAEKMDATRINVAVSNDTVYLMGLVSQTEADQATAVARKVGGVKRVVKVFEIIS
jgi:osmotically-inducible protein OsmY